MTASVHAASTLHSLDREEKKFHAQGIDAGDRRFMRSRGVGSRGIPNRYSGSFPPVGNISGITGTYAGNRLTMKGTFVRGAAIRSVSGTFACTRASSNQTRCGGAFVNDAGRGSRIVLTITWSAGRPVATSATGDVGMTK
jgi:hypothetical protein